MKKRSRSVFYLMVLLFAVAVTAAQSQTTDADVMQKLKKAINPPASLGWDNPDPCKWGKVECANGRVTKIQVGKQGLTGSLPSNLGDLTALTIFEVMENGLTGPLPSLAGLGSLQRILVNGNGFTSIPSDFFAGMNSLDTVSLDNNPFTPWQLPESLKEASALRIFSAINCTISGSMPDIFNSSTFPSLTDLHLSFNKLSGELPSSFSGSLLQTLWLNGQQSDAKLNGTISVLQNMTGLRTVWLHGNSFSGPIPELSGLGSLQDFSLRDNSLTGPVPDSLTKISSLQVVNLTNNMLQGPTPQFPKTVQTDVVADTNSFCLSQPGKACDPRVNVLLAVAKDVGYPAQFAKDWKDNDPCTPWRGITCDKGEISVVNFQKMGLTGTISPNFSSITTLQRLNLANNNLTGNIPKELTFLTQLQILDVSNNQLYGKLPVFDKKVKVITDGNVNIGKDGPPPGTKPPPGGTPSSPSGGKSEGGGKKSSSGAIVGAVVGGACGIAALAGLFVFCLYRTKRKRSGRVQSPHTMVIHPRHSGSTDHDAVKLTIAGSSTNGGISETYSHGSSGPNDVHIIEAGSMMISIQVLKNVTNNFSQHNILGKGGFGTVYGGELHDGTKIAVKRMESGVMGEKGLEEFKSEIAVLTKVRHRHLVALLGYCLDGNERLLVYEYMPQGTLSRYLFDWKKEGLKPLEWMKRITIALDVARAVEYLHGLAQQSFIHRDLKPSNILLGDDMRAKVADFGLVRLAPDGKASIVTKLAGTFGYLAPEYAVTGRVTTKIDVFSFGVILMELITGRKALDESQPEECMHLVPWFRRMCVDIISKDKGKDKDNDNEKEKEKKEKEEKEKEAKFLEAIDPTIEVNEETLPSIKTVTELAGHCCARDPHQRPDMGHVVNALSSLAELWKPTEGDEDELYVLDYFESLPQAVKKWQALEGFSGFDGSSYLGSGDNTQTSIPTRPTGFAESFTSNDAR